MISSDRLYVGALSVQDRAAGFWLDIEEGGPTEGIPVVRGTRVLVPGRRGLYTPSTGPFHDDHLLIRLHGTVWGVGATAYDRRLSYRANMVALKAACDVTNRQDVTLTVHGPYDGLATGDTATAAAGFLRIQGPRSIGMELREIDIHFEATDPPEWDVVPAP